MNFLLRLKSWQLFVITVIPLLFPPVNAFGIIATIIGYTIYIAWVFSIGYAMNALIPDKSKPDVIFFKVNSIFMAIAILFGIYFSYYGVNQYLGCVFIAVILLSFFYCISFAGRMLESMIKGEMVNFSDSLKTIKYIWVFPLGIWYLQPAIKRVLEK